jgi:uncharacterized protein (TIRG00374 family)
VAGLLLVGGLGLAGFAVAVVGRGGLDALRSGVRPDPGMLAVGLLLMLVDVWLGGLRVHILAHRLCSRVRLWDGIRADLANRCLAGITPWQTGGGAAQLYVLARAGLPLSAGVAVGTINFLISTVVLVVLGFSALPFVHEHLPRWLQISTQATLGLLVITLILGSFLIARGRYRRKKEVAEGRIRRLVDRAVAFVQRSLETARRLTLVHRGPVLRVFPITALLFVAKLAYTYAIFRAFWPEGHVTELTGVTVILVLALNFAPTPGGGGVVEGTATAYLAGAFDSASSVGFVLYWRFLTAYFPVFLGGLILLRQLGRDSKRLSGARSEPAAGAS